MNKKVAYFSRSGNSKRIAEKLARGLGCKTIEITDSMDWSGIVGFVKAGFYTSKNKDLPVKVIGKIYDKDEIIVVSPVWASHPAQAVRIYLRGREFSKTHLVLTSSGSTAKKLENRTAFASVNEIVKKKKNEDEIVNALIKKFAKK